MSDTKLVFDWFSFFHLNIPLKEMAIRRFRLKEVSTNASSKASGWGGKNTSPSL